MYQKYEYHIVRHEMNKETYRVERPAQAVELFNQFAEQSTQESLFVLPVDGRNNLIGVHKVYVGTATGTSVRISELISSVMLAQGVGFVVVHNHPSGDSQASDEDIRLTNDLVKAARLLDLEMLDHLVVGKDNWTSIRSQNPHIWGPNIEEGVE